MVRVINRPGDDEYGFYGHPTPEQDSIDVLNNLVKNVKQKYNVSTQTAKQMIEKARDAHKYSNKDVYDYVNKKIKNQWRGV
jgi:hypothetical protein